MATVTTDKYVTDIKLACGSSELFVCGNGFAGTYSAINSLSCSDAACITIIVDSLSPLLTWSMPNIFTPNGDNINEFFDVDSKNAKNIQLTIFNRWGEIMYTDSGLNPAWDGSDKGMPAVDGTYFYKVTVYGMQNEIEEGQGFLHLTRK